MESRDSRTITEHNFKQAPWKVTADMQGLEQRQNEDRRVEPQHSAPFKSKVYERGQGQEVRRRPFVLYIDTYGSLARL